VIFNVNF